RAGDRMAEQRGKAVRRNRGFARQLSVAERPVIGVEPRYRDPDERREGCRRPRLGAPDGWIDHDFAAAGRRESASSAAASVCSTSFVVCAVETNPASNWDGAK